MPADQLIPDAASTTRAITITAPPEQVWPWLVQLGYGRAGWYSYDWIDNDGHPSAGRPRSSPPVRLSMHYDRPLACRSRV